MDSPIFELLLLIYVYCFLFWLLVIVVFIFAKLLYMLTKGDPDLDRTLLEVIEARGFTAEEHTVLTDDGYILTLHRIINPNVDRKKLESRPVLIGHGTAANSGLWVLNSGTERLESWVDENLNLVQKKIKYGNNLGYVLSNLGYDVWLENQRGNRYSVGHKTLNHASDSKYWEFNMDHMVNYDMPKVIDYILNKTQQSSLAFVGYSQANTIMFGLLSEKPEYNAKVRPFIAMAPSVKTSNALPFIPPFIKTPVIDVACNLLTAYPGPMVPLWFDGLCKFFGAKHLLVGLWETNAKFWANLSGIYAGLLFDRSAVFATFSGWHFSRGNFAHTLQLHKNNRFHKFDYGKDENKKRYGKETPADYNLKNITNRFIALMYSKDDNIVTYKDSLYVKKTLSVELFEDYVIPVKKWDHFDYTLNRETGKYINSRVVDILRKSENMSNLGKC